MKFLILLMMYFSFMIMFVTHPMSLGFILLMQTILTAMIINFLNFNFWFSYILFLIMIGGMLILFIYMTSIASNEKFNYSKIIIMMTIMMIMSMMTMLIIDSYFLNLNINNNMNMFLYQNYNFNMSMNKYFNFPNYNIFYMTIIYLLITLIAMVKISNISMGPLRPSN